MAEWIIDGQPEWNMWRLDLRRFDNHFASQQYTLGKTLETAVVQEPLWDPTGMRMKS